MQDRLRVLLLFGGRSAEHDVSVLSAANVFRALDPELYDVVPVAITRDGVWLQCALEGGAFPFAVPLAGPRIVLLPGGRGRYLTLAADDGPSAPAGHDSASARVEDESASARAEHDGASAPRAAIADVIFPVLHGPFGEDGTVQGAAELAGVAYVGSDVLGSAVAMDKDVSKRLLRDAGLPIAPFRAFAAAEVPPFDAIVAELGRPLFVKPARLGSSVGIGKAGTAEEFAAAVAEAARHDSKILVESFVPGREVECGVLEQADGSLFVSVPGEIVPTNRHSFYTYEAKYLDAEGADLKVPAELPAAVGARVRDLSAQAFRVLGNAGLARVDFFVGPDGAVTINEVNTMPGFTAISMYPRVLMASGMSYAELVERLIAHALRRAGRGA